MAAQDNQLLSLSEVARKLNLPYPRAVKLHADGKLVPDFIGPKVILFRPSRIKELEASILKPIC